jgi:hypothetical protein
MMDEDGDDHDDDIGRVDEYTRVVASQSVLLSWSWSSASSLIGAIGGSSTNPELVSSSASRAVLTRSGSARTLSSLAVLLAVGSLLFLFSILLRLPSSRPAVVVVAAAVSMEVKGCAKYALSGVRMMVWYTEAASAGDMGIGVGMKTTWVLFGEGVMGEVRLFRRQTERFDDEAPNFCCCDQGRATTMVVGLASCRGELGCCAAVGFVSGRGKASPKAGSASMGLHEAECAGACGDGSGGRIGVVGDGGIILICVCDLGKPVVGGLSTRSSVPISQWMQPRSGTEGEKKESKGRWDYTDQEKDFETRGRDAKKTLEDLACFACWPCR